MLTRIEEATDQIKHYSLTHFIRFFKYRKESKKLYSISLKQLKNLDSLRIFLYKALNFLILRPCQGYLLKKIFNDDKFLPFSVHESHQNMPKEDVNPENISKYISELPIPRLMIFT